MHSASPPPRDLGRPKTRLSLANDSKSGLLVESALLALAADAGMTPTLKTRLLEVASGFPHRRIAELHGISLNTVKTQINAMLESMGASCCHEIRDDAVAASARFQNGAREDDVTEFLRLRLE